MCEGCCCRGGRGFRGRCVRARPLPGEGPWSAPEARRWGRGVWGKMVCASPGMEDLESAPPPRARGTSKPAGLGDGDLKALCPPGSSPIALLAPS